MKEYFKYEVFEPIDKKKLNLSICDNVTIDLYIPLGLSKKLGNLYNELKDMGFDLFDINSPFYQDICVPYKSLNDTDVLLSDRVNYYYNNDETLCQSNYKFSNYSMETQLLKCECDVSNSEIDSIEVKKFTIKSIYESFYDILKFSNYKVLKCYNLAFKVKNSISNKGSIITLVYFSIYLAFFIIYCFIGIKQLRNTLEEGIPHDMVKPNDELLKDDKNDNLQNDGKTTISSNNIETPKKI